MPKAVFDIYLTGEKVAEENDPDFKAVWGEILIGEFRESFVASVVSWDAVQYIKQWESALRKIVTGSAPSVLITSYVEPSLSSGSYLGWWPLYRKGDSVYIQNQLRALYRKGGFIYIQNELLSSDPLDRPFFLERPWESVKEREIMSEEGSKI
jgi:hypothetical protein